MDENNVRVSGIKKSYGSFNAVQDVSFSIEKGQLVALLGPSGSGKTTILRMLAGLEAADAGDIYIEGKRVNDVLPAKRGIGFLFQNYALFQYMNVYDNIAFGLDVKKNPKAETAARVEELLGLVGLEGLGDRYPSELSGGQRQRVAFARALAPNPGLLLLDEPFAAIDAKVRKELRSWLRDMIHKIGITSVFVTHDQDEAVEVADEIIILNKGRLEQMGPADEIYKSPQSPFVAEFIGHSIRIDDFGMLKGFPKGEYEYAVLRPEFIEAFKEDNTSFEKVVSASNEGIVRDIRFGGSDLELIVDVGGISLTIRRSLERRRLQVGERVLVLIYRMFLMDRNGEVHLIKNQFLEEAGISHRDLENHLYSDSSYYIG